MTDADERTDEERTEEGTDDDDAASKAEREKEDVEEAKKEMESLEEGEPPGDLAEWPGGKAKYLTYGGAEGGSGYEDGPTAKLGPSSLRHHEGGKVTVDGEEVDDPEDYKGEPIPGGPSDPDAPPDPAMIGSEKDKESGSDDDESGSDDDESGSKDDESGSDDDSGASGDSGDKDEKDADRESEPRSEQRDG